jgi:chemotaxis protein MotB
MSEEFEEDVVEHDCPPVGLPPYMAIFADMMALLMVFFVLLLSFSEIDALKYKMVVKSLENAFGVQREVEANDIPKGTSIIAQEFSPGEPRPTPLKEVRQDTIDETRNALKVKMDADAKAEIAVKKQEEQISEESLKLQQALKQEIKEDLIDVETQLDRIVIRIREKGSFQSGDANLNRAFLPILDKIRFVLSKTDGLIVVAGHTDNIPIHTPHYRSNWELSTSRATSVVHQLLADGIMLPERFVLEGHAETEPLMTNDTAENRARNRRVEIIVLKSISQNDVRDSIERLNKDYESVDGEVTTAE